MLRNGELHDVHGPCNKAMRSSPLLEEGFPEEARVVSSSLLRLGCDGEAADTTSSDASNSATANRDALESFSCEYRAVVFAVGRGMPGASRTPHVPPPTGGGDARIEKN